MHTLLAIIMASPVAANVAAAPAPPARDWLALDVFHLSRTLPALSRTLESPLNPGLRASYHHAWLGSALTAGTSLQASVVSFDELFWSVAAGVGLEGVWRSDAGFLVSLGLRCDYGRIFTGDNNFVLEDGRYRQSSDVGRGFLRATPVDLMLGYSPSALRALGIIPALRYAWVVDIPWYANDDATTWSYTEFGLSVLWSWEA